MSAAGQSLLTPSTSTAQSSESLTSITAPLKKPTETSTSYFPEPVAATANAAASSRRSSVSSSVSSQAARTQPCPGSGNPLDILSRNFPAPTEDIDVAKQLAMEPRKHSLHDSLRRAAAAETAFKPDDAETRAQKLAAAKAELLALTIPSLR